MKNGEPSRSIAELDGLTFTCEPDNQSRRVALRDVNFGSSVGLSWIGDLFGFSFSCLLLFVRSWESRVLVVQSRCQRKENLQPKSSRWFAFVPLAGVMAS